MIDVEDFIKQKIKEQKRKEYHREYSRLYNKFSKKKREPAIPLPEYIKPPEVDEERLEINEVTCSHFGCARILTRNEKLFGNKCVKHSWKIKSL